MCASWQRCYAHSYTCVYTWRRWLAFDAFSRECTGSIDHSKSWTIMDDGTSASRLSRSIPKCRASFVLDVKRIKDDSCEHARSRLTSDKRIRGNSLPTKRFVLESFMGILTDVPVIVYTRAQFNRCSGRSVIYMQFTMMDEWLIKLYYRICGGGWDSEAST